MPPFAILFLTRLQSPEIVRTGDPANRGLRESDFPRIQKLSSGITRKVYEEIEGKLK